MVHIDETARREWTANDGYPILALLIKRLPVEFLDETILQALNVLLVSISTSCPGACTPFSGLCS